jgi:hypothetical protein
MLFGKVQIIKENNIPKFAVIDFSDYKRLKDLLLNEEKLEDYLDYLHIQKVKEKATKRYSLKEAKQIILEE